MVLTAQSLTRGLAERLRDLILVTPTSGTSSTLVAASLDQEWPQSVGQQSAPLGTWVYGSATATGNTNRGAERRVKSYTQASHTVTFLSDWPEAIAGGVYEFHKRYPRSQKLDAINSAVRQLGFWWARPVMDDTSLTTAEGTFTYDLPSSVLWHTIPSMQVQISTDPNITGYPYQDAAEWGWSLDFFTNTSGVTTYRLQFQHLPPEGRKIRILGQAGYGDLVLDADILPVPANFPEVQEWIYEWGRFCLVDWESVKQPINQTEFLEKQATRLRAQAVDIRDRLSRAIPYARIVTPVNDAQDRDWPWLYHTWG